MNKDPLQDMAGAFIDNELDQKSTFDLKTTLATDPELVDQIAQYGNLKKQIKQAYKPEHSQHYHNHNSCQKNGNFLGHCKQAMVAGILLVIGLFIMKTDSFSPHSSTQLATLSPSVQGFKLQPVTLDQSKLILHISSSSTDKLDQVLSQAESLVDQYQQNNKLLELEVIANSGGVDLLRTSVSPYANRIQKLRDRYDGIQFVACINTLNRLASEGKSTHLLPGTMADEPVVDKIIGRIQQGWTYIKI